MLKLRRADTCVACKVSLPVGTHAHWDAATRTVACITCSRPQPQPAPVSAPAPAELDHGRAGDSVAREYERRRRNREARTRADHPLLGGLLLAVREAPQHETAFRRGELGEKAVAASLTKRTADGPSIVLHDRRMPRGRGNVDHVAISPTGVFVIDAKHYCGKVCVERSWFAEPKLLIAGRDRTKLIAGLDRQVTAVRDTLADHGHFDVAVQGVLCFTTAELPLLGTLTFDGHLLIYRKALAKRLNTDGPLPSPTIDALARVLADAFPPA